eukprot:TRINITY_DN10179_c0_g1_i1.p1 TRINITY_DN10179_c0_g1~~TRINITY_DN10179_c0_g1_i1.p1  ORF type:complete len:274 (+),score=43.84 TRINITY_DN10179_c0_g1_i1:259-1080(+)
MSEDWSGKSIKDIKAYLDSHNVDYKDCIEKSDLVKRAQDTEARVGSDATGTGGGGASASAEEAGFDFHHHMPVGPLQCNCSILGNTKSKDCLIVDPGGDVSKIMKIVNDNGFKVRKILHTHAHFDHFLGSAELKKETGAPLCLHKDDASLWAMLEVQCGMFGVPNTAGKLEDPDHWLEDGESIELNGRVLHTPGHSPGSCCFSFPGNKLLVAGDTLFAGAIGRSDLWGGNAGLLKESVKRLYKEHKDDVTVITGHGPSTTIGMERRTNPFVKG